MLNPATPALVLAPMDGITDAPMRAYQGTIGAFTYAVSEFVRISTDPLPRKVFLRDVPELSNGGTTPSGMPVQVQLLGGHPERMAKSAFTACLAGAKAIDINFGCPAPTVNRNDGGATLLQFPCRIREVVAAIREAVPPEIPVSAKLRLGWEDIDAIFENAEMAVAGGASWLTIHARTRVQGYTPPVYWPHLGRVRKAVGVPVVANGDIWVIDDFRRCQDETGCIHYMLGRGAFSNPKLPHQIAAELRLPGSSGPDGKIDWVELLHCFLPFTELYGPAPDRHVLARLKQWLKLAANFGEFTQFDAVKQTTSVAELFSALDKAVTTPSAS